MFEILLYFKCSDWIKKETESELLHISLKNIAYSVWIHTLRLYIALEMLE